jgi:cell division protein FtsI (penicillin-binding protein 3)
MNVEPEKDLAAADLQVVQKNASLLPGQNRIRLLNLAFTIGFTAIAMKMAGTIVLTPKDLRSSELKRHEDRIPRPDIIDRNGVVLATDVAVASLYADPRKILDVDEAVEALTTTVPELDGKSLSQKLSQQGRAFVWLKRQVSPEERDAVFNLGLPGIGFVNERRRVYPLARSAAHLIGYVDLDTKGIAGIEKYLDDQGAIYTASLADPDTNMAHPAQMSVDTRVQHALTDEVAKAILKFKAKAGGGIIMDIETGEIVAMASLPDYNPNDPDKRLTSDQQNKMTSGVYELGSVIKAVTFAMALDSGLVTMQSRFDARYPLVIGNARINDFHAQRKILTVPEVFTNSSNIGTARMALAVGQDEHKAFLEKVGLFERMQTELPESARPLLPKHWTKLASATASFGHGFAVQPLQGLSVVAGLLNGGRMVPPTLIKRSKEEADVLAVPIIKEKASNDLRTLFRLNATEGSASKADIIGYRVGGKTGTAEKVVKGRYSKEKRLSSFIGAFPMDAPRYAIFVMLDEPKPLPETYGFATAGWNAVPTAGKIIERIAPLLNIAPQFSAEDLVKLEKLAKAKKKG